MRDNLDDSHWQLFRSTGTGHLMAISGLHVGMVAALFYALTLLLWKRSAFLCLHVAASRAASFSSIVAAFFYTMLCGFAISSQRACVMISSFMLGGMFNKTNFLEHRFVLALLFVLLLNPLSLYMTGFYLSFFVVLILLYFRKTKESAQSIVSIIKRATRIQSIILLLLTPLNLYLFDYVSLASLPANLIAIPLMSLIILPLCLITLSLSVFWGFAAKKAALVVGFMFKFLFAYFLFLSSIPYLRIPISITYLWQLLLMTAVLWLLLRIKQMPGKCLALVLLTTVIFYPIKETLSPNFANITVLDVGQGLAIIVKTSRHLLIYDTGMQYRSGFDMGAAVLIPYLKHHGIKVIDKVIISHEDIDHRGGLESLSRILKIKEIIRNDRSQHIHCHHYPHWYWDGVRFEFLTINTFPGNDNDNSCVLRVSNGVQSILLPGDIEKKAEYKLVKSYGRALKSTLLVVPHHGSKSSSSSLFLKNVSPSYAVISTSQFNHYHFPHKKIVQRYQRNHIQLFNTAVCGQLDWIMTYDKSNEKPKCYTRTLSK